MASQIRRFRGKIYIPPCKNEDCESLVLKIARILKPDLECVTKHNINGSFIGHFESWFQECDFTIIHFCPFLWRRISSFEDSIRKGERKIILVEFKNMFAKGEECSTLNKFFFDFDSAQVLSPDDDVALQSFKDDILLCLSKCAHENDIIESNTSDTDTSKFAHPREHEMVEEESGNEEDEENKGNFEKYPDFFGNKDQLQIFVSQMLPIAQTDFDSFNKTVQQIDELGVRLTKEEVMSTLKYILIGVLPHLYQKRDVVKLASLSTCRHWCIHHRAVEYLEFLLWENVDTVQDLSVLMQVESLLNDALRKLKFDYEKINENELLTMLQRLANVYLLVIGSCVILSQENPDLTSKCLSFLDTRAAPENSFAPLTKIPQLFDLQKQFDASLCLSIIDSVLSGVSKCKLVMKSAEDKLSDFDKPNNQARKPIKKNIVHLVLSIRLLRKVFLLDQPALSHLHQYMQEEMGKCPFVFMILRSLTLFLDHKIQQVTHKEIDAICTKAIGVINLTIPQETAKQVDSFLEKLLFHSTSCIRQGMIQVFNKHNRGGGSLGSGYLQNEIDYRLRPMLTDFKKQNYGEFGWKKAECEFELQKSWILFYNMNEKDHKKHKTDLKEYEDLHYTQMMRLTILQHKNIIKMFAYHQDTIPQFYIIESCEQILQENLARIRQNGSFYNPLKLLQFLLDAISGLIYCHNKNYVHCNLTAQSLIVINNDHIKLAAFGLCKKIEETSGKAKEINSKDIPRRWSAPESILDGEYSKASDIWMMGHLLYEVMTHGCLPYSDLKLNDEEIIERMKLKQLKLTIYPIVEKSAIQQLLSACVSYEKESRYYAANVKTSLKNILIRLEASQTDKKKFTYPPIEDEKLSTNFKKGVPDKFHKSTIVKKDPKLIQAVINMGENMERIQEKNSFTFREKIHHKLSPAMESYFSSAALDNVLPQREVVQYSDEMQYIECKIPDESFSLFDVALKRRVNDAIQIYFFLYQVAATLNKLAKLSFVLGDMCASNIYLQLTDPPKAHIISLAYLKSLNIEDEQNPSTLADTMKLRSAPEVLKNGQFSAKSDIFCFGNLMWETLSAFDRGKDYKQNQLVKPQIKIFRGLKGDLYNAIQSGEWESYHCRPECCPESLYELIKLCVSVREDERPTIDHVMVKLSEFCQTENKEITSVNASNLQCSSESFDYGRPSLTEVNPSIYSESNSSTSLSVRNPSHLSSSSSNMS